MYSYNSSWRLLRNAAAPLTIIRRVFQNWSRMVRRRFYIEVKDDKIFALVEA